MSRTWLDIKALAVRWRTTPGAIGTARSRGSMVLPPPVKLGKKLLWDEADIERFEDCLKDERNNP